VYQRNSIIAFSFLWAVQFTKSLFQKVVIASSCSKLGRQSFSGSFHSLGCDPDASVCKVVKQDWYRKFKTHRGSIVFKGQQAVVASECRTQVGDKQWGEFLCERLVPPYPDLAKPESEVQQLRVPSVVIDEDEDTQDAIGGRSLEAEVQSLNSFAAPDTKSTARPSREKRMEPVIAMGALEGELSSVALVFVMRLEARCGNSSARSAGAVAV